MGKSFNEQFQSHTCYEKKDLALFPMTVPSRLETKSQHPQGRMKSNSNRGSFFLSFDPDILIVMCVHKSYVGAKKSKLKNKK